MPEGDISLLENEGFTFVAGNAPGVPSVVMLNTAKAPTDDPAVRAAIALGTDKQAIIDAVYFGVYQPAFGPLSKPSWSYDAEFELGDGFDPARANQLLDQAGWALDGDFRKKDGQVLELVFIISDWQIYAELWQSQMRDLGIDVKIQQVAPSAEIDMLIQGQAHVSAIEWISSDPGILEYLFHSSNIGTGFAWSRYADPRLDALLEQGRRTLDRDARKELYAEAQRIIVQQGLIVPLFEQTAYNGIGKQLHDVKVDARGWYRWLYDAWLDQ